MRARLVATLAAAASVVVLAAGCGPVLTFEPVEPVELARPDETSVIIDADGGVLAELHGEIDREVVPIDEMAPVLRDAVLAVEDVRFEDHMGVDVRGLARAVVRNTTHGEVVEGGSTITQQLAKNTVTGSEVSLERKLEEASVALRLESQYTKDEILELYLNEVYFGRGAYGVQAAAQRYFSRDASDLELHEAALLAGVLRAPSSYEPLGHPDAARARRDLVLGQMARHGFVTEEEAERASARNLGLEPRPADEQWRAPYFVDNVLRELQHDERYAALGDDPVERADAVFRGGLRIETTLDPDWQAAAEDAVAATLPEPDDPRGAVVAIDPDTGGIRALVGGRDWDDGDDPSARYNLATLGARQPGSTFKTIVLAAALEAGFSLDDQFEAPAEVEFPPVPGEPETWTVANYGEADHGTVSLREATASSVNVVYAELVQQLGADRVAQLAHDLGVSRELVPTRALALGAGEVSVLEMATVQATLASGGIRRDPSSVTRVVGPDGDVLYERGAIAGERVLEEETAWHVTQAMTGVVERGTGERAALGRPVAGKTGTSQRHADAWFTGFTPDLAAAVWIGFPDGARSMLPPETRARVEGGTWPAELFARFGLAALGDTPARDFPIPDGELEEVEVDVVRGCLPTPQTPRQDVEVRAYLPGEAPTERCEDEAEQRGDVPDVAGLPGEEAVAALRDAGFSVRLQPLHDPTRPPGIALEQVPSPGDDVELPDGWVAVVRISSADRTSVEVPDALDLPADDAIELLTDAGFVVDLTHECPDGEERCTGSAQRPGRVWDQSPGADTERPVHDRIRLRAYPSP